MTLEEHKAKIFAQRERIRQNLPVASGADELLILADALIKLISEFQSRTTPGAAAGYRPRPATDLVPQKDRSV